MDHLREHCLPCLRVQLYLCLSHRKHPGQAHLGMAAGKEKLTHPHLSTLSLTGTRKYLQQLITFFYFTSSSPLLCSIKETSIQTQARWFLGTLVHHLLRLLAFRIKSLSLAPTTHLLIYWPVVPRAA